MKIICKKGIRYIKNPYKNHELDEKYSYHSLSVIQNY